MTDNVLIINGNKLTFTPGQTLLEVALENGIYIPTLCYLKDTTPTGTCGICVVEVKGARSLMASCTTPASPGMRVETESKKVIASRKATLFSMLSAGNHNCLLCPSNGNCSLQDLANRYQVTEWRFPNSPPRYAIEAVNQYILKDFSRCILCGRCIQACVNAQINRAIDFGYRGSDTQIAAAGDRAIINSDCFFCGECLKVCPVGALIERDGRKKTRPFETERIRTTCPYCDVGCQQWLHVKDGRIIRVTGVENAEPNRGRLCVKGRFGYEFIYDEERLTTPLIRKNGELRKVSWNEALDYTAERFRSIIDTHGPDALAGISCARSINEDAYQMQKLFRAVFGTNNIDHCSRNRHAPTMAELAASFGSGARPNSFNEFSRAKMILVIGSNMTQAHPVAASYIKYIKNAVNRGARLILIDPKRHRLADFAEHHLPIRVGTDIALLNSLMYVLITESLYDIPFVEIRTDGFDELKAAVLEWTPERAEPITGIPADTIRYTARALASVKPAMVCYTPGITEHTCGKNNMINIANLQMLLGNMGVEYSGGNPLRGQNNVQGACDMGARPDLFPGHQRVAYPASRKKFADAWGVPDLPKRPGIMIPEMLSGAEQGSIRGLYIFGENIVSTDSNIRKIEQGLAAVEFLVCQDIFPTETTRFAHVVFPATAWSENEGTFTNSERRVSRVRSASPAPGDAKPNWWIFREIARRMGHDWVPSSAREIWDMEIAPLAPNLNGIRYHRIEADGLQWPCPSENHPGTPVFHIDGQVTFGRGRFNPVNWTPPTEIPDADYPFILSTGRPLYQYHTQTQTGRCEGLNHSLLEETADISIGDAEALGIAHGDSIKIRSRRGEVTVKACVAKEVPKGMIWMGFHFREEGANWLTNRACDPDTQTTGYKACAVALEKSP